MSPPINTSGSIPVGRSGSARQAMQQQQQQQQQHVSFEPSSVGSTGSSFHPSRSMRKGSAQQHHPYSRSGSTTPSEPPPSPWGGMNGSYPFPGLTPLHEGKGHSFGYAGMQSQLQGLSTSSSLSNTPFGSYGAEQAQEQEERDRQAEENTYWNALNTFAQNGQGGVDEGQYVNGGSGSFVQTNSVPTSGAATPLNGQQMNLADLMSPEFVALLNSAEGAGLSDEAVAAAINGLVQQGGMNQFEQPDLANRAGPPAGSLQNHPTPSSQSLLTRRLQQQQQQQQQPPQFEPRERETSSFGMSHQGDSRRTSHVSGFASGTPNHFSSSLPGSSGRLGTSQQSTGSKSGGPGFGSPHMPSSGFSSSFGYTPGSLNTNRSGGWGPSRGVNTPTTPMTIPSSLSTSVSGPQQPQTPFQTGSAPGSSFDTSAKSMTSKVNRWRFRDERWHLADQSFDLTPCSNRVPHSVLPRRANPRSQPTTILFPPRPRPPHRHDRRPARVCTIGRPPVFRWGPLLPAKRLCLTFRLCPKVSPSKISPNSVTTDWNSRYVSEWVSA